MKIVIQTDADFTPAGKRRVRVVQTFGGRQLRLYVAGRIYQRLAPTAENFLMAAKWVVA